jgi:hypothetical protein
MMNGDFNCPFSALASVRADVLLAARSSTGAGWALAAWEPVAGRIVVVWQVVNWADVAERLTAARRPEV